MTTHTKAISRPRFRPFSRQRRTARGIAATELAVCLPVIVLLVLGTIEACSMIFLKQSLSVAAYEGARTAIVPGATAAQVEAACQQILSDRHVKGGTVTVKPTNIDALVPGDFVDVTVSAPCDANSVVRNSFYRGRTLPATASMMIEL
jgi:Flp pilus assembly protein TadG